jgi:transposase
MAYREVHRMHIEEITRRHAAGESIRRIARATGLARNTVATYLKRSEAAADAVVRPPAHPGPQSAGPGPALAQLAPYRAQIVRWLQQDHLRLTRIHELLNLEISYTSLRRYVRTEGLVGRPATTVRMAPTAPGAVAEMDFGRLGPLVDPVTGKRPTVWALVVVLPASRYFFVWPLVSQTLDAVLEGLEAAWPFFGGIPQRLVLDNFPAAVASPDAYDARLTRGFLEYSQARNLLIDPARVRHPKDKPTVERAMSYVRERFWKGGRFHDLADMREQARRWCREVAGLRVHGTTRQAPRVAFESEERAALQPAPDVPYDPPRWAQVTVHPDHHVSFGQALYSAPSTTCPPGTKLEVRGDRQTVRLYKNGELVKAYVRQARGGRMTDPDDYPAEKTPYALRSTAHAITRARDLGSHVGTFTEHLLGGDHPWAKLRGAQHLLRLADRYGAERLDAACRRALGFELIDVRRVERILVQALDAEGQRVPATEARVLALPRGRFQRDGAAFDHRERPVPTADTEADR